MSKNHRWGSSLVILSVALVLILFSSFYSASQAQSPSGTTDSQLVAEFRGTNSNPVYQLPTPQPNPNKVTPTPGGTTGGTTGGSTTGKPTATPQGTTGGTTGGTTQQSESVCGTVFLTYGQTITNTIDNTNWGWTYCFQAAAGDVVSVDMIATSGNLDAYLGIMDPTLQTAFIESDNRVAGNLNPQIVNFTIPAAGDYVIVATRTGLSDGTTAGNFSMTLTSSTGGGSTGGTTGGTTGGSSQQTGDCPNTMAYGETLTGSIGGETSGYIICFQANAGDVITVDMQATSGNLDGLLMITDVALETTYTENDDRVSGNPNPLISGFTIPAAGTYAIVATRYQITEGTSTGDFSVTLTSGTGGQTGSQTGTVQESGINITCDNGSNITNGVMVTVIQMRPGFTYTATAIGLNGFDPVLAVVDSNMQGLCNDNDANAARYNVSLPTTGAVNSSPNSAQVFFSQTAGDFADISLVVGGYNGQVGEFVVILEGMAVTAADNVGDPFSISVSPSMIASGVPLTVYMIANRTDLDPKITAVDAAIEFILQDTAGNDIYCDDGGDTSICWGQSASMSGAFITLGGRQIPGGARDAMLNVPLDNTLTSLTFLMGSYNQASFGEYTMVFHLATGQ